MTAFQPGAFQSDGFQTLILSGEVEQTLNGFDQTADALVGNAVGGAITQTVPHFTQTLDAISDAVAPPQEPGGGVFLGPGFLAKPNRVTIRQQMPAFTQTLDAEVNDDELVLLLVL